MSFWWEYIFYFHHAPSVITQIFEAVMAAAFEPVQSIVSSRLPAKRIMNDAFSYVMKTPGMYSKLAI